MSEHLILKQELFFIISDAKRNMANLRSPMEISGKELDPGDLPTIAIIEAFISYLNRNKLLVNLTKLDYTDSSCKFESNEE